MHDMRKSHRRKILNLPLRNDGSSIALIYVTIALPVIIGFALFAFDVGRFLTLNSSLAHGADALVLAGAAEFVGTSNAITRAESAMTLFVMANHALLNSLKPETMRVYIDMRDLASHSPDVSMDNNQTLATTLTGEDLGTSGSS